MIKSKIQKDVLLQMELQKDHDTKWIVATLRKSFHSYIVPREHAEQDSKQKAKSWNSPEISLSNDMTDQCLNTPPWSIYRRL